MRVAVGIPVHEAPERLAATLASLRAHGPRDAQIILLPDGPDQATGLALARPPFDGLLRLSTDEPQGTPACWNRLASATEAEVVVLLESGCLVAPAAMGLLMAALAVPRHGLAGPSTNVVWNEQGAFRTVPARASTDTIASTAAAARRRFGDAMRPLTPLHSLADFCFAVRREVIKAVGAADEGYGLGPCWEMDYNVRAARAGFTGVWVCAAYVHRSAVDRRRQLEEERRFDASRRRYQDRFCARRLRGEDRPYEQHCKGDACADFAPPTLIRIHEPPSASAPATPAPAPLQTPARAPEAAVSVTGDRPFVSCIMPTRDRPAWVPLAIRCFLAQDFTDAELVIVDDGAAPVRDCVPDHPRIRYHRATGPRTIGAKRNEACRLARGDLIAHWDDDDWNAPSRLRRQVEALGAGRAEVCGTSTLYFYQPSTDGAWRYQYAAGVPTRMLVGTSLMYRRRAWERAPFPDIQIGEDARFVRAAAGRLSDLADPALCVATVHEANTSPRSPAGPFWLPHPREEIHRLLGDDLPLYRSLGRPLVSCIMPTADRRAFLPLSLRRFHEQDWPNRELIVVDDGVDSVADLVASVPRARYLRLPRRTSIGAKRNLACSEARGELIAHWDDDDWYGPARLSWQVAPIVAGDADLTGLANRFVLRLPAGDFWSVHDQLHKQMFVGDLHGGTIVFRRSLFLGGLRYPEIDLAEDAGLIRAALKRGHRIRRLENPGLFVYVRHGKNAWQFDVGRFIDPQGWHQVDRPPLLSPDTLASYRTAAASPPASPRHHAARNRRHPSP
jgi:glycosyltransferase involved in cell wall biosynthesis